MCLPLLPCLVGLLLCLFPLWPSELPFLLISNFAKQFSTCLASMVELCPYHSYFHYYKKCFWYQVKVFFIFDKRGEIKIILTHLILMRIFPINDIRYVLRLICLTQDHCKSSLKFIDRKNSGRKTEDFSRFEKPESSDALNMVKIWWSLTHIHKYVMSTRFNQFLSICRVLMAIQDLRWRAWHF